MKKCDYCGRENVDGAQHCRECGTAFVDPSATTKEDPLYEWPMTHWFRPAFRGITFILLIAVLYLLSLGPVERYNAKVVLGNALPTVVYSANGQTVFQKSVLSVSYPRWITLIYGPVFVLRTRLGGNNIYERYLEWWRARAPSITNAVPVPAVNTGGTQMTTNWVPVVNTGGT